VVGCYGALISDQTTRTETKLSCQPLFFKAAILNCQIIDLRFTVIKCRLCHSHYQKFEIIVHIIINIKNLKIFVGASK